MILANTPTKQTSIFAWKRQDNECYKQYCISQKKPKAQTRNTPLCNLDLNVAS